MLKLKVKQKSIPQNKNKSRVIYVATSKSETWCMTLAEL
jgi:hypothetical protein